MEEEKIEAYPRIAMEFKWGIRSKKQGIENDAKKLTQMLTIKCLDQELDLGDGINRINKGKKPEHSILFIIDGSYPKNVDEMKDFYNYLSSKYSKIEILFDFPLKRKLYIFE